jgi:signal transduction histidine kinase
VEEQLQTAYSEEQELCKSLQNEIQMRLEFYRTMVHELKTPLTTILATSELLVDQLKLAPWDLLANNVLRGAENLNKRIDELIDLAKGEIGILKINLAHMIPAKLINEIVSENLPLAKKWGQVLKAEFP